MATIAHLANFYGPRSGGIRTTIGALTSEYGTHGHLTHVIVPGEQDRTSRRGSAITHELASPRIPGTGGYRLICRLNRVRALLEEIKPNVLELSDRTTLMAAADWASKRGVPTTLIAHERIDGVIHAFASVLNETELADRLNRRAAARVDQIVCTTKFAGEEFDRIGVPYTRVPLGVDLAAFHPQRRSELWREQFDADVLLMLCSRLSKEKRPEFAFDVLDALQDLGVRAHLLIAGSGPMEHSIQQKAGARQATMLGFMSDRALLARALAGADVLLAPGPIETFGLAALEALASGTPVIANAQSAVPEVIGDTGGCALELDPAKWAQAVVDLQLNPNHRHAARSRATQFTWSRTARRMLACQSLAPSTWLNEAA